MENNFKRMKIEKKETPKESFSYLEIEKLGEIYIRWNNLTDNNATLTLQRFAIKEFADAFIPHYNTISGHMEKMLSKYVEMEGGKPKLKVKLLDAAAKEQPQDYLWKTDTSKSDFSKEAAEYYREKVEVEIKKYPISELLETPVKYGDQDTYTFLKFLAQ